MAPDRLRKHWGFAITASAPLTLMMAVPAFAQGASTANLGGIVPVAVVLGAGGFALVAVTVLRKLLRDGRLAQRQARGQIADLRALVDDYENLIGGSRELTVIWPEQPGTPPRLLGQAAAVLPPGRQPQSVLNFDTWLSGSEADNLAQLVEQLRVEGRPFNASVKALDGRPHPPSPARPAGLPAAARLCACARLSFSPTWIRTNRPPAMTGPAFLR
jgi:hypothetical protein